MLLVYHLVLMRSSKVRLVHEHTRNHTQTDTNMHSTTEQHFPGTSVESGGKLPSLRVAPAHLAHRLSPYELVKPGLDD